LALRRRLHRFTHAGSAEAALEAIEKVSEHNLGLLPRIHYLLYHATLNRPVGKHLIKYDYNLSILYREFNLTTFNIKVQYLCILVYLNCFKVRNVILY